MGPRLRPLVTGKDHGYGRSDAVATLVEYGDYECPYCGRAYGIIKRVQETLGEDLLFVFRNFPLSQAHPHAELAAQAAEAAAAQGQFWAMHDLLYENQSALEMEDLVSYAQTLDLDVERFISDLNERRFARHIAEDVRDGLRSGVNGTPTFFINEMRYDGSWDFDSLLEALQAEISRGRERRIA